MKKKQLILTPVALLAIAILFTWGCRRFHFDFSQLGQQIKLADWRMVLLGIASIYVAYVFRAYRWAYLMRHSKRVQPLSLIGTQVIGFTAVALIGRVADPVRPFLVAKKTGSDLSTQFAVYVVERLFDFGAMAIIIFSVILLSPAGSMPHQEIVRKVGTTGLVATIGGGLFLLFVRMAGSWVASLFETLFGLISPKLGHAAGQKIRAFHAGLDNMRSLTDLIVVLSLSLSMWALITVAYISTLRAFTACPALATMNLSRGILVMAISGGASALQLPIIGWFTQIGLVAAALSGLLGAAPEAATAAAAVLLLVTFLSIIPIGLTWAQFENISLRSITEESEHAGGKISDKSEVEA
ncbi:lysylphosphatidylglycerol synthase transmembrane domain-containing protein [Telmatobacter bradus]|uniref:lysylphosphatidylglycerol synthase transmembrane domain-containing protein n=1 Tax=Telmatobacter bradus TaxID=474953 RepID=UPI003B42DB0A